MKMISVDQLISETEQQFLRKNSNLLALTKNGPNDVMKRIFSLLALDNSARDSMRFYGDSDYLNQKDFGAREEARRAFKNNLYEFLCKAFCRIQRNCVVEFVSRLTPEAESELEGVEITAGLREPLPPPIPQKTAQELLTEEIKHDWLTLDSSKLKRKCNANPAYRKRFDELIATDALSSKCTSLYDAGVER